MGEGVIRRTTKDKRQKNRAEGELGEAKLVSLSDVKLFIDKWYHNL
jgi:hypothetical protein